MSKFVEFELDAGGGVWIDVEHVRAITPAVDGGSRLWMGGGDFFEVAPCVSETIATISGHRQPADNVHQLHPMNA